MLLFFYYKIKGNKISSTPTKKNETFFYFTANLFLIQMNYLKVLFYLSFALLSHLLGICGSSQINNLVHSFNASKCVYIYDEVTFDASMSSNLTKCSTFVSFDLSQFVTDSKEKFFADWKSGKNHADIKWNMHICPVLADTKERLVFLVESFTLFLKFNEMSPCFTSPLHLVYVLNNETNQEVLVEFVKLQLVPIESFEVLMETSNGFIDQIKFELSSNSINSKHLGSFAQIDLTKLYATTQTDNSTSELIASIRCLCKKGKAKLRAGIRDLNNSAPLFATSDQDVPKPNVYEAVAQALFKEFANTLEIE